MPQTNPPRAERRATPPARPVASPTPAPLVWTFDGPFERCLGDLEDTLRRTLVGIGDVSRIALQIELCLPALRRRTDLGDRVQPGFARLLQRLAGYGLPQPPRLRRLASDGPLLTLVIAYRK